MEGLNGKTVALIDADSLIFIIGSNHRDSDDEDSVIEACKSLLDMIMTTSMSTHYIGSFSGANCFREDVYKVRKYKGTRGPKEDWYYKWKPLITKTYKEEYKFMEHEGLEADDVIIAANHFVRMAGGDTVICSNDKDLRQVPGRFFDYKKIEFADVDFDQARRNLLVQYLAGDSTDNIAGVPKVGPVKAKTILDKEDGEELGEDLAVLSTFKDYYGPYYGEIIYKETVQVVQMVQPGHPQWSKYEPTMRTAITGALVNTQDYDFE